MPAISSPLDTKAASGAEPLFPSSPASGGVVSYAQGGELQAPVGSIDGAIFPPSSTQSADDDGRPVCLELEDGTICNGYSFGAEKSIAGELVFSTSMVGYPESVTDPSYRGQILVITFPLVGNYGVPSREVMDDLLGDLPKHFESNEIHIAGLVVASYCGEGFSHFLAESSLGQWLKEQGVPAIHGVDTRALTKRIREKGSMLCRMLLRKNGLSPTAPAFVEAEAAHTWRENYEQVEWLQPHTKNIVADGEANLRCFAYLERCD